jgi:uncharacterized protein
MNPSIKILWNVRIPMRDGVKLSARIYRPPQSDPQPVILTMTPYGADNYHSRAMYFAEHGYNFAIVDCRGRGDSEGDFIPDMIDADDGYDTVEFLASQSWCDGQVALWGGSYSGDNQWKTLRARPPHLKTIAPAAASHIPVDYVFSGPVRSRYALQWLALVSGRSASPFNLFAESKFWISAYTAHFLSGRPFNELEAFVGKTSRHFREYLEHPRHHDYWKKLAFFPDDFHRFDDIPILTLAGQYDDAQRGSLYYLAEHERNAAAKNHFAVIGAWDHGGTRTANHHVGGADFGEAATIDMNHLHLEWYDWVMKNGNHPTFLQDRIAYYVTGSNEWRYAASLNAIGSDTLTLYLSNPGTHNTDVFHAGGLQESIAADSHPGKYTFDPRDTRIATVEQTPFSNWLTNQRYDLNLFGNGLVYHTEPFEKDMTLGGYAKLTLFLQMNVPDADFQVTLSEVAANGSYLKLSEDFLRARYRNGLEKEIFSQPDEINSYEFTGFTFFAREIKKGSRLRLVIKCPNSIFLQKNFQSGANVDTESADDAQTAHITIFNDPNHPSSLQLPLISNS